MLERIRKYRRDLHQIPECGFELPKTIDYILNQVKDLPCEILKPAPATIVLFYDAGKEESVAFRSDMDALPVKEASNCPIQSKHVGKMHACGHDGHMAMLLEFAQELKDLYKTLPHNTLLIFQPAEETSGGALPLCNTGILQKYHVKRIFGFHLWPTLPKGVIATRKNEFLARTSEVNVFIEGKSCHTAKYKEGIDALEAACTFLYKAYKMEQEEVDEKYYRILRFNHMESGTIRNVVSNHSVLEGSLRVFQNEIFDFMQNRLYEIAKEIDDVYHTKTTIQFTNGYDAVMNDSDLVDDIMDTYKDRNLVLLKDPEMVGEDFSFYQKFVPGVFFFLGTGTGIALHANNFDFDEEILLEGVKMYMDLAKMA